MSGSIPSWARVGAKCVCWREPAAGGYFTDSPGPEVGRVYTITRAEMGIHNISAVALAEVPITHEGYEAGWELAAFRPLVSHKTLEEDVALIKSHLRSTPPVSSTVGGRSEVADA